MTTVKYTKIMDIDAGLIPFAEDLNLRDQLFAAKMQELAGLGGSLADFANGHNYFGIHPTETGWVYREWAPAAESI